jgi:hypothetical protein
MRFPLVTHRVEDGDGVGQPVAFAVLCLEDEGSTKRFLNFIAGNNDISRTKVAVVDKDMSEINAIRQEWPHVSVILCYFHVIRAIDRKMTAMKMSADEKEKCENVSLSLHLFIYTVCPGIKFFINIFSVSPLLFNTLNFALY